MNDELPAGDWTWLLARKDRPFLLALPLTRPALAIIRRLHDAKRSFLCIEETSLTGSLLRDLHRRVLVAPAPALIRHRRTAPAAELARTIYITFPDHHRSTVGASRLIRFLGADHYVPVTESLLYFRGVAPLVTLTPAGLARYEVAPHDPITEEDALALLRWLLGHVETVIRSGTSELLSASVLTQRTKQAVQQNRGVEAKMLEGFVRAGRTCEQIDTDTFRWSLEELARITKELR